jgi:hypothetical protein
VTRGDVAAELVRGARLTLADAFNLGRVQGIDLRPAPARLLMTHPQREREQGREVFFQRAVAADLVAAVADEANRAGCART